tara:strand:- start:640 stop:2007 length:1368 start_codon:yes stop_codon:yes gene_type:complete
LNPERLTFSAWIYLSICVVAIIDAFMPEVVLKLASAVLIVLYLALQIRWVPLKQGLAGLVLIGIGSLAAWLSDVWLETLIDGLARSRIFLLLFFAVAWLQYPVGESSTLKSVREAILNQPPGKRFLVLSFGVHMLGAILNVAAVGLLSPIFKIQSDPLLLRRLSLAVMHGFTSASAWSPFYIGMIVVLVAIPSLTWQDVALQGMALAPIMILGGWLFDRLRYRQKRSFSDATVSPAKPEVRIGKTVLLLASLIALVFLVFKFSGVNIAVALGMVCPPYALIWYITQGERQADKGQRFASLCHRVVSGLPSLRNETLMFVAANVFGIGIASAIPAENLADLFDLYVPIIDLRIVSLAALFLGCGFIGLHPVVVVLTLGAILTPEIIGLRDWVLGMVFLGCWGLSTMVSPYSGTTLIMSRFTGIPSHVIGWRWAPYSVLFNAILMLAFIIVLRHATL